MPVPPSRRSVIPNPGSPRLDVAHQIAWSEWRWAKRTDEEHLHSNASIGGKNEWDGNGGIRSRLAWMD